MTKTVENKTKKEVVAELLFSKCNTGKINFDSFIKRMDYHSTKRAKRVLTKRALELGCHITYEGRFVVVTK